MTSDNNRVVQGLWSHGRLSALQQLCIRSFAANGHEFHLYAYEELPNVPQVDGVKVMPGESVLPAAKMFLDKRGRHALFADQFRWELLRQRGGWWADMDMVCLRPLDLAADVAFAPEAVWNKAAPSFMKFSKGHFFAEAMANACANVNRFTPWDTPKVKRRKIFRRLLFWRDARKFARWGEAGGPDGMSRAVDYFGINDCAVPFYFFYAIPHAITDCLFNDALSKMGALEPLLSKSYAVHFWNQHIRDLGIDVNGKFPADSPYEILKRRYAVPEE